jgi:hypothetical protein
MSKKLLIQDIHKIAKDNGIKCVSKEYVNCNQKIEWECQTGHVWGARYFDIRRGHGCPFCAGLAKGTIGEMQEIARKRMGKCISKEYVNSNTKLQWECSKGHRWWARPKDVKLKASWCPKCSGNIKSTFEDAKKLAKMRGFQVLSKKYSGVETKLLWQCKNKHAWEASYHNIKSGTGCPRCCGLIKSNIQEMREIARERGGKCLSKEYVNSQTRLTWECAKGHIWEARPSKIKFGQWCPKCNNHISEEICRKYFEHIFQEKFPKKRLKWLISPRTNSMELDGYCEKLGIAFEYQGIQHYKKSKIFELISNL